MNVTIAGSMTAQLRVCYVATPAHQFIYFNEEHNWCSHLFLSIITLNFLVQPEGVYNVNLAGHPSMS